MDLSQFTLPLIGGILIGVAASLLLLINGRVFGVSGILAGAVIPTAGDMDWRVATLGGLMCAGVLLLFFLPEAFVVPRENSYWRYVIAGLLVGFGTQLGGGCTSGHGVCGISRLSPRSIAATVTFIIAGMIVVAMMRSLGMLL